MKAAVVVGIGMVAGWASGVVMAQEAAKPAAVSQVQQVAAVVAPTIYGRLSASLDSIDNGKESEEIFSSNTSYLGFKGDAKLSDTAALKAIWQLEAGVDITEKENNNLFSSRDSFVGMASDYGQVWGGRHDTPVKMLSRKTDFFGDQIGDSRNLVSVGGFGWDLRPDNILLARTPSLAGLQVTAAYAFDDEAEDKSIASANAMYSLKRDDAEIAYVGAGYETHGNMLTASDKNKDGIKETPSAEEESAIRLIAGGKVAGVGLALFYETLQNVAGAADSDSDVFGAGASYGIGQETLKAQYYVRSDEGSDAGADLLALGVDHNFTKQIKTYLNYSLTQNEAKSSYTMSGDGHGDKIAPAAKGADVQGVSLGMMYCF